MRSDTDTRLRVEVDSVEGLVPFASSRAYLSSFFGQLLDKPDGVVFEDDETLAAQGSEFEWTFEDLDAFARAHASGDEPPGTVTLHVLALDGRYVTDDGGTVLGLAWDHRFIALFQDALRGGCSAGLLGLVGRNACEVAERNVWAHEIGHNIGLVDNGLPMQTEHRDPEHGRHDITENCLMYWAYDSPALFDTLLERFDAGQSPDLDLCAESQADVAAAR